jgi:hypothetical protein
VGAFSTANIVLERSPFDVQKVFGKNSSQANQDSKHQNADFIGEAIHCPIGSSLCTTANGAEPDSLPTEPGGYNGFEALFGAKYINIAFGAPLEDLDGNVLNLELSAAACSMSGRPRSLRLACLLPILRKSQQDVAWHAAP